MITSKFEQLVDEIVVACADDMELKTSIKWIDAMAQNDGVSFYEKIYEIFLKLEAQNRAKQWMEEHGSNTG